MLAIVCRLVPQSQRGLQVIKPNLLGPKLHLLLLHLPARHPLVPSSLLAPTVALRVLCLLLGRRATQSTQVSRLSVVTSKPYAPLTSNVHENVLIATKLQQSYRIPSAKPSFYPQLRSRTSIPSQQHPTKPIYRSQELYTAGIPSQPGSLLLQHLLPVPWHSLYEYGEE
jgi:hypothetical protein